MIVCKDFPVSTGAAESLTSDGEREPYTFRVNERDGGRLTKGTIKHEKDWCRRLDHWTGQAKMLCDEGKPYAN